MDSSGLVMFWTYKPWYLIIAWNFFNFLFVFVQKHYSIYVYLLQACEPAASLALEDVNNRTDLLTGFTLKLHWNDSEVAIHKSTIDCVCEWIFHYILWDLGFLLQSLLKLKSSGCDVMHSRGWVAVLQENWWCHFLGDWVLISMHLIILYIWH